MLRWCSRHPIWFMAGYLMLYLAVFRWQELHLTPVVWVHTPLDDLIPFCEYAIRPIWPGSSGSPLRCLPCCGGRAQTLCAYVCPYLQA